MKEKIFNLSNLSVKVSKLKNQGKKIVHCHGVFDVLHLGHIQHFASAKKRGDVLVVTITPDDFVNKGPNRPVFPLKIRMQCIAALGNVDFVAANNTADAISAIKILKPDIYCKGKDYKNKKSDITGKIVSEEKTVKKLGGEIYYTQDELLSSSKIINNTGFNLTTDQKKFLDKIRLNKKLNNKKKLNDNINSFSKLNVLVIGETILDEYVYCEALGKSGKDPVLVLRELYSERYLGGALSIAKNLSSFCKKISLLSYLGEKKEHESFITKNLEKNISTKFIYKENSCTILKKRFLDNINKSKILGVHSINDEPFNKKQKAEFHKKLKNEIKKHDIVIVSDYGHGLIQEDSIKIILKNSKFLAVNAQINSANIGYHTISKYKGADLIIINENEMRHELRNKIDGVDLLIKKLSQRLKSKFITVTSGEKGVKIFNFSKQEILTCPAFANKVADKIGTGDTMLALLTICIFKKINLNLSLLIASLAAAENIKYMANSETVAKNNILKTLEAYLK